MPTTRETDWRTLLLLAAMYAVLFGNFALYEFAPLPVLVHVLVATAAIHLSFTIWHECVHRTVSANAWINDAAGVLGVLPYMAPFYLEKWFHLQHHALLNKPEDPNFVYTDGPLWKLPLRYVRVLRYAHDRMNDDPRTGWQKAVDWIPRIVIFSICAAAVSRGMFREVLLLWFVPFVLSKLVMDWYVNYLPHVGLPPHRFRGTRIVDVRWLSFALLCHNYHAIHHLWPSIPWHRYRATFTEKFDYLREHGVPIEKRITWSGVDAGKVSSPDPLAG